jgi:hypothetical protein
MSNITPEFEQTRRLLSTALPYTFAQYHHQGPDFDDLKLFKK